MVFLCALRRVHATMTNRTGIQTDWQYTRTVGHAPEALVGGYPANSALSPVHLAVCQRMAVRLQDRLDAVTVRACVQ